MSQCDVIRDTLWATILKKGLQLDKAELMAGSSALIQGAGKYWY